jgi:fructokinase
MPDVNPIGRRVVCWGEILWDRFPEAERLGGAPANVAYHLGALGAPVAMLSRVGDDPRGRAAIRRLADRGVATELIQVDPDRPTGVVDVQVQDGEPSYSLRDGGAWQRIECDDQARGALGDCSAFCFGTLAQMTAPGRASFGAAIAALPRDCLRVCDPNLRPRYVDGEVLALCLGAADVIKINEGELALIQEALGVADALAWMFAAGARLVALTRGPAGSRLISRETEADHPGLAAGPGGDNVGAGDGYTAVLALSLLRDRSLPDTVEACNRYGAFVASHRGATPDPSPALVRQVLA